MAEPASGNQASSFGATPFRRSLVWLWAAVIVLSTFAAYGPSLHGDLLWDDDAYVSENPHLAMPGGLWRIWSRPRESPQYYPMVFTSFWLESRLWGLSTFGLHSVNVALHAACALLLWRLLAKLGVPGAWLAGAVFALHPVHVESVAWITERKNVLSCLFYLWSFNAWLEFRGSRRRILYAGALLCFAAALLSKTVTCSLPAAILLVHWWRREPIDRNMLRALAPFAAAGLVLGLCTAWLEKVHVGAEGEEWALSLIQRVLLAGRALWFYAAKLCWPANLVFNYPRWTIDPTTVGAYLYPIGFIVVLLLLWAFRSRIGRGPLAGVLFFAITLAPALGFIDVYPFRFSFVADHFQYHASLGLIALVAGLLVLPFGRTRSGDAAGQSRAGGDTGFRAGLTLIVPLVLGGLTYRQCGLYENLEVLWRRTIAANDASWLARFNLAGLLVERGRTAEAEAEYRRVIELNPRMADAHWNLGNLHGARDEHEHAMRHYRAALEIEPDEPTAHFNMAKELERVGDVQGAIAGYRQCLEGDPLFWAAHNNLGLILLKLDRASEAWEQFGRVLTYFPTNAPALHNRGMILESRGDYTGATELYLSALRSDAGVAETWYRMAVCWQKSGGMDQAAAALSRALELAPDHPDALADQSALHYSAGRLDLAVVGYRKALRIRPGDAQIRHNLSVALQELDRPLEARQVLEDGLRLVPGSLAIMHDLAKLLYATLDPAVRDVTRATDLASEVVRKLDPPSPDAFETLARARAAAGQWESALQAINQAIELAESRGLGAQATGLQTLRDQFAGKTRAADPPFEP